MIANQHDFSGSRIDERLVKRVVCFLSRKRERIEERETGITSFVI
jgi:hypothetical protein